MHVDVVPGAVQSSGEITTRRDRVKRYICCQSCQRFFVCESTCGLEDLPATILSHDT